MTANNKQVAGSHYRSDIQHWDYVIANELDYFQAQITKYVTRWKKKNGITDLEKAQHFLEKYIETEKKKVTVPVTSLAGTEFGERRIPPKIRKLADQLPDLSGQKHPFGYDHASEN